MAVVLTEVCINNVCVNNDYIFVTKAFISIRTPAFIRKNYTLMIQTSLSNAAIYYQDVCFVKKVDAPIFTESCYKQEKQKTSPQPYLA